MILQENDMAGELMVEEYKSLRRELLQLAASISRWQLVGFASAGIALGVALLAGAWIVSAAALLVIAGCIYGIIHDLTSILRIAAYIQVFHEGRDTGALWESRLEDVRDAHVFSPLRSYMTPIPSLWWVGMVCALFAGFMPVFVPPTVGRQFWALLFPLAWIAYWRFVWDSYDALKGIFKNETRQAFYDSLRKPNKTEPK